MATETKKPNLNVHKAGNTYFSLPAGYTVADLTTNFALVSEDNKSPGNPLGIVKEVQTRGYTNTCDINKAMAAAFTEHGGQPLNDYKIGDNTYVLPPGNALVYFESHKNFSIIDQDKKDRLRNPCGVIDSIDAKAYPGEAERTAALVSLLTKHGAQPVRRGPL